MFVLDVECKINKFNLYRCYFVGADRFLGDKNSHLVCRFHYPKKISTFVTRKTLMFRSKTNTTNKKYNSVLI